MTNPRRTITSVVGAVLFGAVLAGGAAAAPGDLDATFAGDGLAFANFTPRTDFASDVGIQADGKIVAAGDAAGNGGRFALVRYTADGMLDPTFGGDGKVTTNFTSGADVASAVAIQSDGKIVVAGGAWPNRFAVARYLADGTLDPTFGGDGKVTTAFPSSAWATAAAVVVQSDGRIVVAGGAGEFGPFGLVRYTADGMLDPTFSRDGIVRTRMGHGEEFATALTLQPDGKIVAAGYTDLPHEFGDAFGPGKFAVARYGAGGRLDPSFDGDGKVKTAFAGGTALAYGVALAPGGEIVVAGDVDFDRFALVRYTGDGSLDPAFSGNGKVATDFTSGLDSAHDVAVQADGKIVAAGDADFQSIALARYGVDGMLDSAFGAGGKVTSDVVPGSESARGVALQPGGGIVVAGYASGGGGRFAIARYLGG